MNIGFLRLALDAESATCFALSAIPSKTDTDHDEAKAEKRKGAATANCSAECDRFVGGHGRSAVVLQSRGEGRAVPKRAVPK